MKGIRRSFAATAPAAVRGFLLSLALAGSPGAFGVQPATAEGGGAAQGAVVPAGSRTAPATRGGEEPSLDAAEPLSETNPYTAKPQWRRSFVDARRRAQRVRMAAAEPAVKTPDTPASAAMPDATGRNDQASKSYALGMTVGLQLRKQSMPVELDPFMRGLDDVLSGNKTRLTDQEARTHVAGLLREQKKRLAGLRETGRKNQQEGQAFLASNKSKEGVVTLPSGLQYRIVKVGDGRRPTPDDTVVCNYRGTLIDGTEFDSSSRHDGPTSFSVRQVIKGWTEALQLMPTGSKWQLFVPPELAYGERGAGPAIGPGATLIFDLELVSIAGAAVANAASEKPSSGATSASANQATAQ
jgi:FKBP-type peptidyl-prolyl cis-trans isomerase